MKQSPLKNKPANIKAPKLISKIKSPGKALTYTATTASSNLLPSAALAIDSTASKSSLTKRITLPCTSSTMDVNEPLTPLTPVATVHLTPSSAPTWSLIPAELTSTSAAPMTRSVWYLGGNQIIKLLTSVDGDLDHAVLANIADVPSVVGDLALSVESLVSDDFTVGGFETDLLAKIAANTLAAKRASVLSPVPAQPQQQEQTPSDLTMQVTEYHYEQQHHEQQPLLPSEDPMTMTCDEPQLSEQQLMTFDSVPNPLADYQPVPNPLARITPPPSPLITIDSKPTEVAIPPTVGQMIQAR